jgi:prepilin-type N-terminal cleavage/methylation domain-containing protein
MVREKTNLVVSRTFHFVVVQLEVGELHRRVAIGMQTRRKSKTMNGFTLIELMIVIAIIGILASIAIPQYSLYRTRSLNAAAQADLRNAATAQEAYFMDHGTYTSATTNLIGPTYMLFFSQGVNVTIVAASTDAFGYVMYATHERGDATFTVSGSGGAIN